MDTDILMTMTTVTPTIIHMTTPMGMDTRMSMITTTPTVIRTTTLMDTITAIHTTHHTL